MVSRCKLREEYEQDLYVGSKCSVERIKLPRLS